LAGKASEPPDIGVEAIVAASAAVLSCADSLTARPSMIFLASLFLLRRFILMHSRRRENGRSFAGRRQGGSAVKRMSIGPPARAARPSKTQPHSTLEGVWVYTAPRTNQVLYSQDVNFAEQAEYYKGVPGAIANSSIPRG
jgi:hypothetical protein